jgi:hypothetical protein
MARTRQLTEAEFDLMMRDALSAAERASSVLKYCGGAMTTGNYNVSEGMAQLAQEMVKLAEQANGIARLALSRHVVAADLAKLRARIAAESPNVGSHGGSAGGGGGSASNKTGKVAYGGALPDRAKP